MSSYLSSGLKELDGVLGGGMLPSNSYLLEVEPGTQELAFMAPYLFEGLRQGNFCMLLLFDMPHDEFINKLTDLGVNMPMALESGSAVIADLWDEGKYDPELKGPVLMTDNLNDPNTILRMYYDLTEVNERKLKSGKYTGTRIAVMSMSSQIMNYRFEPSYKMNGLGVNLIRQRKFLSLCTFSPSMFDKTVVAAFEHLYEGLIVLSMKETKGRFQRYLRIKESPIGGFYTQEVPCDIVEGKPRLLASSSGSLLK